MGEAREGEGRERETDKDFKIVAEAAGEMGIKSDRGGDKIIDREANSRTEIIKERD